MLQVNPVYQPKTYRSKTYQPDTYQPDTYQPTMPPGSESVAADWVTRRNCADIDPNVFFPSDGAGVIAAQKVCAECPVKDLCREYALANNITHGVWGGTSERQRRRILRDRRRAAKVA